MLRWATIIIAFIAPSLLVDAIRGHEAFADMFKDKIHIFELIVLGLICAFTMWLLWRLGYMI